MERMLRIKFWGGPYHNTTRWVSREVFRTGSETYHEHYIRRRKRISRFVCRDDLITVEPLSNQVENRTFTYCFHILCRTYQAPNNMLVKEERVIALLNCVDLDNEKSDKLWRRATYYKRVYFRV